MKLKYSLNKTKIMSEICDMTDYQSDDDVLTTVTEIPDFKFPENNFSLGLIIGPSGSGKSTILKSISEPDYPTWSDNRSVADHFASANEAREFLGASGLNSVPAWLRPYGLLSNGEKYRADLSRQLKDGAVIDEFTSVVDRNVAKSCSTSISKFIRRKGLKNIVFASCHYDIADWLEPDWIFDCLTGKFIDRGSARRPEIIIKLIPAVPEAWPLFSNHHYLTGSINRSARCWIAVWGRVAVGFASAIAFPNGSVKNAWRGHRTVVLPEFQGMGIGAKISDAVGKIFTSQGCRYFSKSAHPALGLYRESSKNWRPTTKNKKARPDYNSGRETKESKHKSKHVSRVCFSHEYIDNNGEV